MKTSNEFQGRTTESGNSVMTLLAAWYFHEYEHGQQDRAP